MLVRFFAPALAALAMFAACSDDENCHECDSTTTDAGATADTGATPTDSGGGTATPLNGCTTYTDGSTITWSITSAPPATCLRVKKGATVTFNGDLASHPIGKKGGDSGPFDTTSNSGSSKTFTFDKVGTFGFTCTIHPSMVGAISVTE